METLTRQYTNEHIARTIGELFDYAVNDCALDGDALWDAFVQSGVAKQIEDANPKYSSGMSSVEVARIIYLRTNIHPADAMKDYIAFDRSPEYWSGWILALYQMQSHQSYAQIHRHITFREIVRLYFPYHEAPEEKAIAVLAERTEHTEIGLKTQRERAGLSQSELAAQANISIKTIQAYEQGYKDIANAKYTTIKRIAETLGCLPEDLL